MYYTFIKFCLDTTRTSYLDITITFITWFLMWSFKFRLTIIISYDHIFLLKKNGVKDNNYQLSNYVIKSPPLKFSLFH